MNDPFDLFLFAQSKAMKQTVNEVKLTASTLQLSENTFRRGTGSNDYFVGSDGIDKFDGGAGDDVIMGRAGNDELYGGRGNDVIDGGKGDDLLNGGSGNDWLNGGDGKDKLFGGAGDDFLLGGKGDDYLQGGSGNNFVFGQDGNDTIIGAPDGSGTLDGGAGNDFFYVSGGDYSVNGGLGFDTLDLSGMGTNRIDGKNIGLSIDTPNNSVINDTLRIYEIEKIIGTVGNDYFIGNNYDNVFIGGKGNDLFVGSQGNDFFEGGDGNDTYIFNSQSIGSHLINYNVGHDMIIIDIDPKNNPVYNITTKNTDIVIKFESNSGYPGTITIQGAADAYKNGSFGIAESTPDGFYQNLKTVGGAVNLEGGAKMVGGSLNDTLSVMDSFLSSSPGVSMTGGRGADTFILGSNGDRVTITDFKVGEGDKIKFDDSTGINSFKQLLSIGRFDTTGFNFSAVEDLVTTNYSIVGLSLAQLNKAYSDGNIIF